jgi:hypothetical protein
VWFDTLRTREALSTWTHCRRLVGLSNRALLHLYA